MRKKLKSEFESIYVFDNGRGIVKIGRSKEVPRRKRTLETQSGADAVNFFCTEPCSNGHEIEKLCHLALSDSRVNGEWFSCSFEEAKKAVIEIFHNSAKFDELSVEEIAEAEQSRTEFMRRIVSGFYRVLLEDDEELLSERLNFDKWAPSKEDEENALKLLLHDYEADIECTDGDFAQEYIDLYNAIKKDGLLAHKRDFQDHIAESYYAVDGDYIERYGEDSEISLWIEKTILT